MWNKDEICLLLLQIGGVYFVWNFRFAPYLLFSQNIRQALMIVVWNLVVIRSFHGRCAANVFSWMNVSMPGCHELFSI